MSTAKKPQLSPGEVVGERYRIDGVVGKGGFGAVYRATQLDTGVPVALKVLIKNFSSAGTDYKRFQREAALVQKLRHPNVVELLDYGQTDRGQSFIAFELLEGRSLSVVLKQGGAMGLLRAGRIARDVLSALEAAHALGIIHRDIKPQNIFLCEGTDLTKVLDFGIAKAVTGEEAGATQLTEAGQMIGTPHYMAPEQVRGTGVFPATDLYSVGLLIAEMLSGTRVVAASSLIDVYMVHIKDEPLPFPNEVKSSPLAVVIERATAKQLADRYKSATEMAADLDKALPSEVGFLGPASTTSELPLQSLGGTSVIAPSMVEEALRGLPQPPATVRTGYHDAPPSEQPQSVGSTVVIPPADLERQLQDMVAAIAPAKPPPEDPLNATVDMTAPLRVPRRDPPRHPTPPHDVPRYATPPHDVPSYATPPHDQPSYAAPSSVPQPTSQAPSSAGYPHSHPSGIQPSPLYGSGVQPSPMHAPYSGREQFYSSGEMFSSGEHHGVPRTEVDPRLGRRGGAGVALLIVAMVLIAAAVGLYLWAPWRDAQRWIDDNRLATRATDASLPAPAMSSSATQRAPCASSLTS